MPCARTLLLGLCGPLILLAQTPAPAQQAGLQPDWDVRVILGEMSVHATRLQTELGRLNVQAWLQKGASDTYATQLQSGKDQARSMAVDAKALAEHPERLSACLELYFRIHALEQLVGSLVDGARKYQDGATADRLASLSAENGGNRNRFEAYLVNLATEREQECAVMDREAQRCRAIIATQPPDASKKGKK